MRILVVMGTRPEAIKLAPVVAALRRRKGLKTYVCATAQHRELLDQVLTLFALKPDFDLDLMRPGQSPDAVARRVLRTMGPLLERLKPGMVVVQGDTTTAAAATLCACERGIPVAHVEAGLRSFDLNDPFPEERNRIVIDLLASLLFPPTAAACENLTRENIRGRRVLVTGNTIVDALRWARCRFDLPSGRGAAGKNILVTLHRREIHGAPLKKVYAALLRLVCKHEELTIVYPVHPNPAVLGTAKRMLRHPRIRLLSPQPYPKFLALLERASFLITDSGGLQEEAVCLGKPVLVVRRNTERPEVITSGAGRLVGLDPKKLTLWAEQLLRDPALSRQMSRAKNPYGDGRASGRIAASIAHWFGRAKAPKAWTPSAQRRAA
jgi:UDP-N-acetylglucosamine 2-epimerase (non-hydrolysing)